MDTLLRGYTSSVSTYYNCSLTAVPPEGILKIRVNNVSCRKHPISARSMRFECGFRKNKIGSRHVDIYLHATCTHHTTLYKQFVMSST